MSTTLLSAVQEEPISYDINIPYTKVSDEEQARISQGTPYPEYLPTWDKIWFDPLPPFDFSDPALRADPNMSNLFGSSSAPNAVDGKGQIKTTEITPRMGTILENIDISTLTDAAKSDLALLTSTRKIVVLPSQRPFFHLSPGEQQEWMNFFGKPNYQPVSGSIKGHPGFHIIHRDGNKEELDRFFERKTTSTLWHQDVSYERQPPGYVMLGLLQGPETGGDTVFADTAEAYKRLSPTFRSLLEPLKAVHSSSAMIAHTRLAGGLVRKDPVQSIHPLVRVHPVTKERSIFINGEFITGFGRASHAGTGYEGMKDTEYKAISDFLLQHIVTGHDFQARVKWSPETVVLFDNRSTLHSAIVDYFDEENGAQPRHIFRLAAMAEVPVPIVSDT